MFLVEETLKTLLGFNFLDRFEFQVLGVFIIKLQGFFFTFLLKLHFLCTLSFGNFLLLCFLVIASLFLQFCDSYLCFQLHFFASFFHIFILHLWSHNYVCALQQQFDFETFTLALHQSSIEVSFPNHSSFAFIMCFILFKCNFVEQCNYILYGFVTVVYRFEVVLVAHLFCIFIFLGVLSM